MSIESRYFKNRSMEVSDSQLADEKDLNSRCVEILKRWFDTGVLKNVQYSSGEEGSTTYYFDLDSNQRIAITIAYMSCIVGWNLWFGSYSESHSMAYQNLRYQVNHVPVQHIGIFALYRIMKTMDKDFTK